MGLFPIEVWPDPDGDPFRELHIYEMHNSRDEYCVTVVAAVNGREIPTEGERLEQEHVRDWAAYMAARPVVKDARPDRVAYTTKWGNKLPEEVARSMFPRITGGYYRS